MRIIGKKVMTEKKRYPEQHFGIHSPARINLIYIRSVTEQPGGKPCSRIIVGLHVMLYMAPTWKGASGCSLSATESFIFCSRHYRYAKLANQRLFAIKRGHLRNFRLQHSVQAQIRTALPLWQSDTARQTAGGTKHFWHAVC